MIFFLFKSVLPVVKPCQSVRRCSSTGKISFVNPFDLCAAGGMSDSSVRYVIGSSPPPPPRFSSSSQSQSQSQSASASRREISPSRLDVRLHPSSPSTLDWTIQKECSITIEFVFQPRMNLLHLRFLLSVAPVRRNRCGSVRPRIGNVSFGWPSSSSCFFF